ncbi:hypothetical protein QFC24_000731 [Naganishia onofrii]|uniref:Uncharacterized protein n=1 Tax=Naganishia onofrii TaxID=1851511 RepID=A0ACC2XV19_9TREE|nr:hypothetical protein QFC24_000731 [Naganishia onofrii]
MGVFSWLNPLAYGKKAAPTDYETVLSRLSSDITEAKQHLSEIRLRQRRVSLLINLYGVILWLVWCGLWYFQKLPWGLVGLYADDMAAQAVGLALVVMGPIGLLGLNRLNGLFFSSRRTKEETHLRDLLKSQHDKIEEIKKATNYYSTRDLLEKYDELSRSSPGAISNSSRRGSPGTPSPSSRRGGPGKAVPNARTQLAPLGAPSPNTVGPGGLPVHPQAQAQMQLLQQQSFNQNMQPVLPTPTKKWYDHVADKLMGEDPCEALDLVVSYIAALIFALFDSASDANELRQRKGKAGAGSSGLKNEVEQDDVAGSVGGDDRMDVDEPSARGSAAH